MKKRVSLEQRKQNMKKKKLILLIALALLAVLGIGGGVIFAKYYSINYREGVSVASGLYFGSNKLTTVPGQVTNINSIAENETESLPVNVNTTKWSSGETTFDIEIRNFENHLLYNDASLTIEYEVCFLMLDAPAGANYYVEKNGDSTTRKTLYEESSDGTVLTPVGTGNAAVKSFNGTLPGGSLSSDRYTLTIKMVDAERYDRARARVLAVAYPIAPDYVKNDTYQQNRLLGVFQGVYSQIELSVDTAGFKVQGEADYNTGNWKNKVEDLSGLIYNVKTKGDIVTDDNDSITVKPQVIIRWKTDYLKISEYDEYYLAAKAQDAANVGNPDAQKWFYTQGDWTYLRVSAMPYTSIDVTFYKTDRFMTELSNGTLQKTAFEELVNAYIP
ncbi:MAG: hypothetical protein ACI4DO_02980 [Roseburia sp.]